MTKKARKTSKTLDAMSQKRDTPPVGPAPVTDVRIYQEKPGDVPLLDFVGKQRVRVRQEIIAAVEELRIQGHRMRPPHNEHLGGQLYYLRIDAEDGTYRVFYWPHGRGIVILGHGFSKKTNRCPTGEIKRAEAFRARYAADPEFHTYRGAIHVQDENDD